MYVYVCSNIKITVSLRMLATKINSDNSKQNNKSKNVFRRIYIKKSPNSNLLNLITYKAIKVCSLENGLE